LPAPRRPMILGAASSTTAPINTSSTVNSHTWSW
jgi:hypothetical protein